MAMHEILKAAVFVLSMSECQETTHDRWRASHHADTPSPDADPGGGRWGASLPRRRRDIIQNKLFNSI